MKPIHIKKIATLALSALLAMAPVAQAAPQIGKGPAPSNSIQRYRQLSEHGRMRLISNTAELSRYLKEVGQFAKYLPEAAAKLPALLQTHERLMGSVVVQKNGAFIEFKPIRGPPQNLVQVPLSPVEEDSQDPHYNHLRAMFDGTGDRPLAELSRRASSVERDLMSGIAVSIPAVADASGLSPVDLEPGASPRRREAVF
ncbi:MAG: hypothetical protein HY611_08070, partial [Elusimicrobia bacterium]|nr:hypothetical protein [Elusimicrobiota bacterium]